MIVDLCTALIRDEQTRSGNTFIRVDDLDAYLAKLAAHAEILSDSADGRCRGLVAFYCNDLESRKAFVTLVLVNPLDRGAGLGRALLAGTLDLIRSRGFSRCGIEVAIGNQPAYRLYQSLGFLLTEDRGETHLMEIAL